MSKFEKIDKCPRERCKHWSGECQIPYYTYTDFNKKMKIEKYNLDIEVCILDERLENLCELK